MVQVYDRKIGNFKKYKAEYPVLNTHIPADAIHYMTPEEIEKYGFING